MIFGDLRDIAEANIRTLSDGTERRSALIQTLRDIEEDNLRTLKDITQENSVCSDPRPRTPCRPHFRFFLPLDLFASARSAASSTSSCL